MGHDELNPGLCFSHRTSKMGAILSGRNRSRCPVKSNQINSTFVFTRVALNSHATDKLVALEFPIELEFRNVEFCRGRKTGGPGENSLSKDENQQQTQPTCDTGSRIRTRSTLVGGERDHHCAISFEEISLAGYGAVVPCGHDSSILPARIADHSEGFDLSCPLTKLAIYTVVIRSDFALNRFFLFMDLDCVSVCKHEKEWELSQYPSILTSNLVSNSAAHMEMLVFAKVWKSCERLIGCSAIKFHSYWISIMLRTWRKPPWSPV